MKKMSKKGSTDQSYIRKRNTTYKIGTLATLEISSPVQNCNLTYLQRLQSDLGVGDADELNYYLLCLCSLQRQSCPNFFDIIGTWITELQVKIQQFSITDTDYQFKTLFQSSGHLSQLQI